MRDLPIKTPVAILIILIFIAIFRSIGSDDEPELSEDDQIEETRSKKKDYASEKRTKSNFDRDYVQNNYKDLRNSSYKREKRSDDRVYDKKPKRRIPITPPTPVPDTAKSIDVAEENDDKNQNPFLTPEALQHFQELETLAADMKSLGFVLRRVDKCRDNPTAKAAGDCTDYKWDLSGLGENDRIDAKEYEQILAAYIEHSEDFFNNHGTLDEVKEASATYPKAKGEIKKRQEIASLQNLFGRELDRLASGELTEEDGPSKFILTRSKPPQVEQGDLVYDESM